MIPLGRATMCLDESLIFDRNAGNICPRCGSTATWPVSRWLDREREELPPPVTITVGPLELLALAHDHGLDVSPESWA